MKILTRTASAAVLVIASAVVPLATAGGSSAAVSCPWMNQSETPATRTAQLLSAMTLDDKITEVSGIGEFGLGVHLLQNPNTHDAGTILGNAQLCIPALVLNDAGAGIGDQQSKTTAFPDEIGLASTWNPSLQTTYGATLGAEAQTKGVNVVLAPGADILRTPLNGRQWEYAGEDPYLTGQTVAAEVTGLQSQHVLATVKHYALNDQEADRMTASSDADDRTIHEIDLPAFQDAVDAGVAAVMCSYNRVNSVYACENPTLLDTDLKQGMAFNGFVMSDWLATHSTAPSANAGLDMEMPGGVLGSGQYFGPALKKAVQAGQVPLSRLNDMVSRILLEMFTHGLFDHVPAEGGTAANATATNAYSLAVATQIAEQGSVLLKNDGAALPLTASGKKILVVGSAAGSGATLASQGFGSGHVPEIGTHTNVVTPLSAITTRAAANHDTVTYNAGTNAKSTAAVAAKSDLAIVFVNDVSVEGADRPSLNAQSGNCNALLSKCTYSSVDQNALVAAVAAANPNTIVVIQSGGAIAMPWLSAVKAVVENWLPGQVDGSAIAPLLFGDVNFSGKLPETFPVSLAQTPLQTAAQYPGVTVAGDTVGPHVSYSEGLLVGYRWYTAEHITPLFPFGYGLSYTSFAYSNLAIAPNGFGATVTATVTNTGSRAGAETAQLYVTDPAATGEPPIQLKGFDKISLAAGASGTVTFNLPGSAFQIWNSASHGWTLTPGCYGISVGGSSASLPLHDQIADGLDGTC